MAEFINFGSFGQATMGEMTSFLTLLKFKVSGGTLDNCAVSVSPHHMQMVGSSFGFCIAVSELVHCVNASAGVSGYPPVLNAAAASVAAADW